MIGFILEKLKGDYISRVHCKKNKLKNLKFSIKDFFSKCGQIRSFPRIWTHLLKKSLIENFIFV